MNKLTPSGAIFSTDMVYRYELHRVWDNTKGMLMYIGLNASTADATKNDPTVERCVGRAQRYGYGGMFMSNLFALRSTDPQGLHNIDDPVGPENDDHILAMAQKSDRIVCCWGELGIYKNRDQQVIDLLQDQGYGLFCLGVSRAGHPKHPLYLPNEAQMVVFKEAIN